MRVIIYTFAYNAEKTLERPINSVLNQTFDNWVWYLVDNGSTDATRSIIESYASKDMRIIPLKNEVNNVWESGNSWFDVIREYDSNDFFCELDADDEYRQDYIEKMLEFAIANNLDLAACGYLFVDASSEQPQAVRILGEDFILDTPEAFSKGFPLYHQFMRTMWCKLYRVSLLKNVNFANIPTIGYGWDTLFTIENFRNAKRVGILSEALHKYYVSTESYSYYFDNLRVAGDRVLDDTARTYLIDKCGKVTTQNDLFLKTVYYEAINDTVDVILHSELSCLQKLHNLRDIVTHEKTKALLHPDSAQRYVTINRLLYPITNWYLSQVATLTDKASAEVAADILLAINTNLQQLISSDCLCYIIRYLPELVEKLVNKSYTQIIVDLNSWYKHHDIDDPLLTELELSVYRAMGRPDYEVFALLVKIKKERQIAANGIDTSSQIVELIAKYPLLKDVSAELALAFSNTVCFILKEDYNHALEEFVQVSQDIEISDDDAEAYFILGANLAAAAENADIYIYFKKIWISYLLDCSRMDDAKAELDEFDQLFPDDEDFTEFRARMSAW